MRRIFFVLCIINNICCLSKAPIDSAFYTNTIKEITQDYRIKNYEAAIKNCDILIKKGENELEYNNDYLIYGYHARGILNYYNSDTSSGKKDLILFTKLFTSKNDIDLKKLINYSTPIVNILTNKYPDTTFLVFYYEQIIRKLGETNNINNETYHNIIDEYIGINTNFIEKYDFLSKQFQLFEKNKNVQVKILEHYMVLYNALTGHDNFSDSMIKTWAPRRLMDTYLDFSSKAVSICEKYKPNDTLAAFYNNVYGFMLFGDNKTDKAIQYLKKSIEISYSIKFYPERFIESIKFLSTLYNYKGDFRATIDLFSDFDKLNLIIPSQYSDDLCANRIDAIYSTSRNVIDYNNLVDSIKKQFNCKCIPKSGMGSQKRKVEDMSTLFFNIDSLNFEDIPEYISKCQELNSEGNTELAELGFQRIGELLDKSKQYNIPAIKYMELYYNMIYTSYIEENNEQGRMKVFNCIQKIEEILNDITFQPPVSLQIGSYMILMDYFKEHNELYKAKRYGSIVDSNFSINKDNTTSLLFPSFAYSYYDISNDISILQKAIKIEEQTSVDVVSYQSYIKIFKELYYKKDKPAFEGYVNRFIPYLESFINLNYLYYDKERQDVKLTNYLIDIDMLLYFSQKLKCSENCLNSLYAVLFSLRDLEVNTYKYLKNANPKNLEEIKRFNLLRDSIYQVGTNFSTFPDNDLDGLLKQLNLEARKLMLDSKLKLVQFEKYNPDSIRTKLKPNECFLFNFRDAYFGDSSRQLVLKYDTLKFGIGFDKSIDNKSLIVRNVLKHSPSIKYIKPNDKIIQVNNVKYDCDELAHEIFNSRKIELTYIRGVDTLSNIITRDSVFYEYYSDYENWIIIDNNHDKPFCLRVYIDDYNKLNKNYFSNLRFNYDANTFKVALNDLYPLVKNYSNIYYSLAGKYSELNIEWLQNPADSFYLGIKHNFYNCSSVSDFYSIKNPTTNQANKSMIIFSNPTLSNDNLIASNIKTNRSAAEDIESYYKIHNKPIFINLPSTAEESSKITKIGIDANINVKNYTMNDCSELNIKLIHSPSILHIATHGYVLNKNDSITVFQSKSGTSNLFNTALILSEYDKNLKEDGILTAYEIMQLDLKNTELVVLSACETANGQAEINGNSSNSLQKAFRLAGARAVLASKWKVPDQQTQELMVEFYTNWLEKKMSKHKALQQAQLSISKKYPEPYYWAAWVLYGE